MLPPSHYHITGVKKDFHRTNKVVAMVAAIPMPMSELCDRLTISILKLRRLSDDQADKAMLRQQIDYYRNGIDERDTQLLSLIADLELENGLIWDAEHNIRKGLDADVPLEEIGRRALIIRDINMRRIAVKNSIAKHTGQAGFVDVKMNYARDSAEQYG